MPWREWVCDIWAVVLGTLARRSDSGTPLGGIDWPVNGSVAYALSRLVSRAGTRPAPQVLRRMFLRCRERLRRMNPTANTANNTTTATIPPTAPELTPDFEDALLAMADVEGVDAVPRESVVVELDVLELDVVELDDEEDVTWVGALELLEGGDDLGVTDGLTEEVGDGAADGVEELERDGLGVLTTEVSVAVRDATSVAVTGVAADMGKAFVPRGGRTDTRSGLAATVFAGVPARTETWLG
jgi:hypothetical protein